MELTWENYGKGKRRGRKDLDYEVYISTCRKNDTEHLMSINFANKGKAIAEHYSRLIHTEILPTSTRIYFNFIPAEAEDYTGYKMSLSSSKRVLRAQFPIASKTKYDVIRGNWTGTYKLEYDSEAHYYYIDIKTRNRR